MKRFFAFLAVILLLTGLSVTASAQDVTGTYSAVTLLYGPAEIDASQVYTDFTVTLNADGSAVLTMEGVQFSGSWSGNTASFLYGGVMEVQVSITESGLKIDNFINTGMTVLFVRSEGNTQAVAPAPVVTAAPAPVVTAAPAPVVTAAPAPVVTAAPAEDRFILQWESVAGATGYTVYEAEGAGRDAAKKQIASVSADTFAYAGVNVNGRYIVEAALSTGGKACLFYYRNVLNESWSYASDGRILNGTDFANSVSYEYVYEGGNFSYRKMTMFDLDEGDFLVQDSERAKIGSSRTYPWTPAEVLKNCMKVEFSFEITEVVSGRPYGIWRFYGRDAGTGKWREYSTFKMKEGEPVHTTVDLNRTPSLDKLAIIGPNATYSVRTSTSFQSITMKDFNY